MAKIYTTAPHAGPGKTDAQESPAGDAKQKTIGVYDQPRGIHSPWIKKFGGIAAVFIILLLLIIGYLLLR